MSFLKGALPLLQHHLVTPPTASGRGPRVQRRVTTDNRPPSSGYQQANADSSVTYPARGSVLVCPNVTKTGQVGQNRGKGSGWWRLT